MKKQKKWTKLLFVGIMSISAFSCSDDKVETEYDYDRHYVDSQPTVDDVKTLFNGKVALLQPNSDNVLNYLTKRLVNTTTELTDDADAIVMDETKAQSILNNKTEYTVLKKLWNSNKIIIFITPGSNAFILLERLNQLDPTATVKTPAENDLASFENIHIYATRADGSTLYHEKIDTSAGTAHSVTYAVTENEKKEVSNGQVALTAIPNEYNKGRIAENVASWLNDYALIGTQRSVDFVRSDNSYSVSPIPITHYSTIYVTHDWVKEYCNNATVPNATIVDAKSHMDMYGTYSTTHDCDVYDINVYEEFPANKTYVENVYVYEYLAYNYKYTGGCYYGPTVDLYLKGIQTSSIEVEAAAPLPQTNGQYNNTHYPMQLGFGSSLQANISTEPGLSAGLSMNCQLPYTTTSFNHPEMPIDFSNDYKQAKWEYSTDYDAYKVNLGFNPKFLDIPDVVHSFCKTDQAVTFIVNNAKSYGEMDITLHWDIKWCTYSEFAEPWGHWWYKEFQPSKNTYKLPKVNRFFEKYTPYPLPGYSGSGDSNEWGNLEERLMRNINYRALCDETLLVGAQTEKGLDLTAANIWRTAIESLVTQYNGTGTNYEYVIALARGNGTHINLGLHIKDGVWNLVENVDNIIK